jgi:hypothetical protein
VDNSKEVFTESHFCRQQSKPASGIQIAVMQLSPPKPSRLWTSPAAERSAGFFMPVGDSTVLMQNGLAAQKSISKGSRRQERARIVKMAGFFTPGLSKHAGLVNLNSIWSQTDPIYDPQLVKQSRSDS